MIKKVDEKNKIVYFTNNVEDEDIEGMIKILQQVGKVKVSFNVIGRTLHQMLGNNLIRRLKQKATIKGYTDYTSYNCVIELDKKFKAHYQFEGTQGIKYYKDQFNNWYGVVDNEINYCCYWEKGQPPVEKLEFDRQVFDVELIDEKK